MKPINILLIIFTLFLVSCEPTKFEVENKQANTSIEVLEMANQDTTLYKVVILNNDLYAVNTSTNLVEYKVNDDSSLDFLLGVFFFLFMFSIFVHIIRD